MTIQHRDITDAERHAVKGASTATNGQVLKALGSDNTTFVAPSTLINTITTTAISQGSVAAQTPSALDTAIQVEFGAAASTTDVSLASNGTVTINTAGYYIFTINLNFTRTTGAGAAYMFTRILVNDVPTGFVECIKLDTADISIPFQINLEGQHNAANTIKVQLIRDSLGINNGSLSSFDPVTTGWAASPSAWIRIAKVQGAS